MNIKKISDCKDPALRARLEAALAGQPQPTKKRWTGADPAVDAPAAGRRVRQSGKGLNKLEAEWLAYLQRLHPGLRIHSHGKTYLLANGVRYTPEFVATVDGRETAWEVKGPRAWDDALVKAKVAPTIWPEVRWIFVWKQGGEWRQQELLP